MSIIELYQGFTKISNKIKYLMGFLFLFFSELVFAQDTTYYQLFNGEDLTGWQHIGEGSFVVEGGMLKTEGGMGLLWYTGSSFENVIIRVRYKTTGTSNSGVFIRIPVPPDDPWVAVNKGYEVQIDDHGDKFHTTGTLYSLTEAKAKASFSEEWNTMEIILDGLHTKVKINGKTVTDFTEGDKVPPKRKPWEPDRGSRPTKGYLGLQNHQPEDTVYFKEISVRKLTIEEISRANK